MINHIKIQDFAIIENVDVDFSQGLSIITGETGSGKSILVTAISLALGSRADSSYVRNGKEKAIIQLLGELDGEEILITREINPAGKNLCKINGEIVTLSQLAEKCSKLADIHGQYDNQSLLNPDNHLALIDKYAAEKIEPVKEYYLNTYSIYQKVKKELSDLIALSQEAEKKADYYRYTISEIERVSPLPGEDESLKDRLSILQNSEKIFAGLNEAYEELSGGSGAYYSIGKAIDNLEAISSYSSTLEDNLSELRDVYYRVEDLNSSFRSLLENLTYEPHEVDETIERLDLILGLKKKYGGGQDQDLSKVLEYKEKIQKELSQIENFDNEKAILKSKFEIAKEELYKQGKILRDLREESANRLCKEVMIQLKDLNFQEASLDVIFTNLDSPSPIGMETCELLISTNVGEPLKPLAKTASGGEISRIMLAIKNVSSQFDNIGTLIFDEIDQGISGRTAAIVGGKLKEIAKTRQVICITHLPQIASMSDNAYRIFKESDSSSTFTHVTRLNEEEKIMEIARLLGGEDISETAVQNARELVGLGKA